MTNWIMNITTENILDAYKQAKPLLFDDLNGCYVGKVLSLPGGSHLPNFLYKFILALVNSPAINFLWKGKYFNKGCGSNLWFFCKPKFMFAHYDYSNHQNAVRLNYNVSRNPKAARGFSAILKRSSDDTGLLIGEAFVNGKRALYFSLKRIVNDEI